MKIDANDKEVQDVFSSGYFQIPRFQRPFSWGREEVESFWGDIVDDVTDNYFIGSMVVYQIKKPYFGIVDGQQRLTTITIALSAIRDAFVRLGEINLAKGVHKFIETPNNDYVNEFVVDSESSFPFFQNNIQSFKEQTDLVGFDCEVGVEESNLKLAYDVILKKLEEVVPLSLDKSVQIELFSSESPVESLKRLRDKFLSLKLVFIQLDNEEDAYLIFETLNARGRDLRTSDLVKNLILKTVKASNVRLDSAKEAWGSLVKGFDDISEYDVVDSFLLHYWISRHEFSTDKKLYSNIKSYIISNEENAKFLLEELCSYAKYYCRMLSHESFSWSREEEEVKLALKSLNSFKVKQQSSFILSLLAAYYDRRLTLRQLRSVIKKIEHFHFVFNAVTQQRSSGVIATMYSQNAIMLSKAKDNDSIQRVLGSISRSLSDKVPSYDEFEVKFIELGYLSTKTRFKGVVKYSLGKLLGDSFGGLGIDHDRLTVEHIIPESWIKRGASPQMVGNIGNLALISHEMNSSKLNDKEPLVKFRLLREEGYPLNENYIFGNDWGEEKVMERAKKVARHVYDRVSF